jgi:hypothetical protein
VGARAARAGQGAIRTLTLRERVRSTVASIASPRRRALEPAAEAPTLERMRPLSLLA